MLFRKYRLDYGTNRGPLYQMDGLRYSRPVMCLKATYKRIRLEPGNDLYPAR